MPNVVLVCVDPLEGSRTALPRGLRRCILRSAYAAPPMTCLYISSAPNAPRSTRGPLPSGSDSKYTQQSLKLEGSSHFALLSVADRGATAAHWSVPLNKRPSSHSRVESLSQTVWRRPPQPSACSIGCGRRPTSSSLRSHLARRYQPLSWLIRRL